MASIHIEFQHLYHIPSLDIKKVDDSVRTYFKSQKIIHSPRIECEILFVDSSTIHQLNKKYRNTDTPTDVLSFPLWEKVMAESQNAPQHLGSIVINGETIKDGATKNHRSITMHVCALAKHSIRHLIGRHHQE